MSPHPRLIVGGDAGGDEPPASITGQTQQPAPRTLVWDAAVRAFHWLLVACVLGAWITGGSGERWHEVCGSIVAALLIFRIFWGFLGTPHARFEDFIRSPRVLVRYLGDIARNRAARHVGHNPAGAYMILALLLCLAVITATGFMQLSSAFFGISWVETTHHYAANVLLALIPLHVLGALVSSWMHQENLIGAMFGGRKAVSTGSDGATAGVPPAADELLTRIQGAQGFSSLMLLVACGAFTGWALTANRVQTAIAETPPTPTTIELSRAVQTNAEIQAKDKQDYIVGGPEDASQSWLISSGGRLYDNWYGALGTKAPASTHRAWPGANTTSSGPTTWRCKSCHGWDYMGREGQYGSGPNATGIIGIHRMRGRDPNQIVAVLGNATHGYSDDILPQHAKYRIALFVSKGQHTANQIVLPTGRVRGDATAGKPIFQSVCASCHGFDGRARKLGVSSDQSDSGYTGAPLFVGTKANSGPVEVLHKIRNGHPGAIMVSMRPFSMDVAANILAYAQTLPTK